MKCAVFCAFREYGSMRKLWLFGLPVLLALSGQAVAQPSYSSSVEKKVERKKAPRKSRHKVAKAVVGEPKARIRQAADGEGLTPLEFATWLARHPRFARADRPALHLASSPTKLLNRSATHFAIADRNGDGRVSAAELADFIDPLSRKQVAVWSV